MMLFLKSCVVIALKSWLGSLVISVMFLLCGLLLFGICLLAVSISEYIQIKYIIIKR